MSAESLFSEGNEAFVDDDYSLAVQKYAAAIELDSGNSKYYTKRATALIKIKRYQEALSDASSAIALDSNDSKSFLKKGVALFHLNKFTNAKEALDQAFALDGSSEAKKWIEKCETELKKKTEEADSKRTTEVAKDLRNPTKPREAVLPKVQSKPRYDWYQTDARVVVTILVKKRSADDVECDIKETSLSICIKLEDGSDYRLSFDLAHPVVADESRFKIMPTKIEIQLKKAEGIRWSSLEAAQEIHLTKFPVLSEPNQSTHTAQEYPTSSHVHRNWDKLAADIEEEEKNEKQEGDAALNALFQKIYGEGSDEVKRAMNKSFVESGGTVLSTNWGEVGSKKVECKPPDGMEFKKY